MEAESKLEITETRWGARLTGYGARLTNQVDVQGLWAIGDQAIVSLGNFVTTIILGRSLLPAVYGVWTVLFGLILFLNVVHFALIVYPLTITAATGGEIECRDRISSALALTVILSMPLWLVVIGGAWIVGSIQSGVWACLALLCWQLQETTRRALMARFSCRKAMLGDAISYLCQAALIWMLVRRGELSLARAFAVIALTCGVAAMVQAWQLRSFLRVPSGLGISGLSFWKNGRWLLWYDLATNSGFQATPWVLFLVRGAEAAAGYQAISNLVGLAHPVMLSLGNVIIPQAARARAREGVEAARRVALVHSVQGGFLLCACFGILMAFPKQLLGFFYGSGSVYLTLERDTRLFAVVYLLFFIALALKFLLNALQETRSQLIAELFCGGLLAITIVPLVTMFGLAGAIGALGLWFTARVLCGLVILRRVNAREEIRNATMRSIKS
jgi:O-antigen/teichoic acid export membrane protein